VQRCVGEGSEAARLRETRWCDQRVPRPGPLCRRRFGTNCRRRESGASARRVRTWALTPSLGRFPGRRQRWSRGHIRSLESSCGIFGSRMGFRSSAPKWRIRDVAQPGPLRRWRLRTQADAAQMRVDASGHALRSRFDADRTVDAERSTSRLTNRSADPPLLTPRSRPKERDPAAQRLRPVLGDGHRWSWAPPRARWG
jgi:hypothetical protein